MDALKERLSREIDQPSIKEIAPAAGLVAVVVAVALAAGVGLVMYRRRRRRSLVKRLQDALPEMDELRASLKRPLERAVKVL
jgi:Flp pilus assembly protein TadB